MSAKTRSDAEVVRPSSPLQDLIEGLALQKPKPSAATIHRKVSAAAKKLDLKAPSYNFVYKLVRQIDPALLTLAHEGASEYSNSFDLIHRREADAPNAIWQADHTELDILIRDEKGEARKPWLTIVLDDYSRAIAGYLLCFSAPSALQTALALRHLNGLQREQNRCRRGAALQRSSGDGFASCIPDAAFAQTDTRTVRGYAK